MRSIRDMEKEAAAGHIKPVTEEPCPVQDGWIETLSGKKFHFNNPALHEIVLDDIATVLSRLWRYNGHTNRRYVVGEHACHLADWVERQQWSTARDCLTALHHDDAEYIIGDMARPLKVTMPQFKAAEEIIDQKLAQRFGTIWPMPKWMKMADSRILCDERAQVMNESDNEWGIDSLEPLGIRLWNIMGRFEWFVKWQWLRRHRKFTMRMAINADDYRYYQ